MSELQQHLGLARIVKLSSNEGAFGPLPAAVAAYEAAARELNRYPDGGGVRLREALAERHDVPVAQVVLGNGADELIRLCAVATLEHGDAAAFPWPSFPSYATAAECSGADALRVPLAGRAADLGALLERARGPRTRLVYLANPNNPTGSAVSAGEVRGFLDALPEDVLCVLDEAYAEYADPGARGPAARARGPSAPVRPAHVLQGLRAGRPAHRVRHRLARGGGALNRVRPIFNVNQPAQEAALAALGETAAVAERVAHAHRARERLYDVLAAAGLGPEPSQANFVFADVPGGDGVSLARRLLEEEGILVRELPGFGAPGSIRVTVGTDEENDAFAEALPRVVLTPGAARAVPPE